MAKNIRRMLATVLVMCMFVSALPLQALAAEGDNVVTETVTEGGLTTEITTTTTQTTDEATGNVTVTVEIQKDTTGTTDTGADLERHETTTEIQTKSEDGKVISESGKNEGNETITDILPIPENGVTVEVPTTEDDPATEEKENVNTETFGDTSNNGVPSGDINTPEGETTTTVTPGEVTVTTTDVIISEVIETEKTDMEYVKSETTPDGTNDLVYVDQAPEEYLPGYDGDTVIPELPVDSEGTKYNYVYVGSGNTSKLVPAIVFDEPLDEAGKLAMYGNNAYIKKNSITWYYVGWLKDEDKANIAYDAKGNYVTDEEGYILDKDGNRIFKEERTEVDPDGNTTYLHRFDNYNNSLFVEGWYEDGEWVEELNGDKSFGAIWAGPQQFVLVDGEGNVVTTYCADFSTPTQDTFGYNVENLEDATYYSEEEAKRIRTIALNGYWGTGNETDADGKEILDEQGNPIPKVGSLAAMKASLLASGEFTEDELKSLTDGVALTATQMAIWSNSNKMAGINYVNAHYSNWGVGNVPEEKEDEVKLLFRVYDYLMALEPTEVENTTAEKIINADNFVSDMSVTVIEKADDHENNDDDDTDNDAYVTNLTFALVVKPSTENGDDLVVSVLDKDGNPIASARIAGEAKEGEELDYLKPDENGNYCFQGITMIEGEQNFKLNLSGIQHLKEGVYLYSSEVRDETSSQTLVGLSGGNRGVNVTMDIKFELDVQDGVVATERVWEYEYDPKFPQPYTEEPEPAPEPAPEPGPAPMIFRMDNEGLQEIPEEPVPLAAPVSTGDNSGMWIAVVILAVFGIVAINLFDKKRQHEAF